jgi:hypothetical protein
MEITDLYGFNIQISDMEMAIEQTEYFKDCHHIPMHESDKERQRYWTDMYHKLIELKAKLDNPKNDKV